MSTAAVVPLDNDHEFEWDSTRKNTDTGNPEASAGLTGVTGHFSLTVGGEAIADTETELAERSGTPGRYFGILDLTDLNTALGPLVNQTVHRVIVVDGHAEKSTECVVRATQE